MLAAGPLRTAAAASISGRTRYRAGGGSSPPEQLVPVLEQFVFQLGAAQDEHAVELVERDPVQEPPGLGEGEPELLQGHDPVELFQLVCRVAAVPRPSGFPRDGTVGGQVAAGVVHAGPGAPAVQLDHARLD